MKCQYKNTIKFPTILTRFILIASILLVSFSGCKKYEDDDYWFTLQSPERRVDGRKVITEYTLDGADSLSYFTKHFGEFYIQFSRMKTSDNRLNIYSLSSGAKIGGGTWGFETNSKKQDRFIFSFGSFVDQFVYSSPLLSVKKLTKDEFHLECDSYKQNAVDSIENLVKLHVTLKFKEL